MSNPTKTKTVRETALGIAVEKTAVSLADIDLFTVTGEVMITLLYGIVTGVGDGGATTIKLNEKASSIDLCAAGIDSQLCGMSLSVRLFSLPSKAKGVW